MKLPFLKGLAPTQSEPPFVVNAGRDLRGLGAYSCNSATHELAGPPAVADRPVGRMKSKPVGTNQAKELTRACPRDAPSAERIGRCVRNVAPTGNVAGRSIPRAQRGVSSSIPIDFLVRRPTKAGPAFGKC
jgi:hypothetical protein